MARCVGQQAVIGMREASTRNGFGNAIFPVRTLFQGSISMGVPSSTLRQISSISASVTAMQPSVQSEDSVQASDEAEAVADAVDHDMSARN